MKRNRDSLWFRLLMIGIAVLLASCGDRGKGVPPELKRVVIGTSGHIKAKRDSTHGSGRPLPIGVTHQRFKDGKLLANDAPHPYILSSGSLLVDPRKNALVQVAYHEDSKGTLSDAVPSSFIISDPSIVSAVVTHPKTNAAMVTLTGKKGNSFITALDGRGDAISKFMVLSAEPQEDVLIVSDPDIHPMLCKGLATGSNPLSCYTATATTFDRGHVGDQFFMDDYLKNGRPSRKFILFDDASLAKLRALNTNGSDSFGKRAIYFEKIDTLFVMNDGISKISSMPVNGNSSEGILPNLNALEINYVATQEEFNKYIDFGGRLTSSPLRDFSVTDIVSHEITPDNPAKAVLVGAIFNDGSRVSASTSTIQNAIGASRSSIKSYVYKMHPVTDGSSLTSGGMECRATVTAGNLANFTITSLKSVAKLTIGGDFAWNGGHPNLEVDLNPQIKSGGQVKFLLDGRVKMGCEIEFYTMKTAEWGVPLFATVQLGIPIAFAVDISVNGAGDIVLALPGYDLGSPTDTSAPGKVGLKYNANGGFKSDFQMQSTVAKDHLGIAEGTKLRDSTKGEVGMGFEVGPTASLELEAYVNAWLLRTTVRASIGEVLVGFKADGAYEIDTAKKSSKMSSKGDAGFGAFMSFSPTITVKSNFFTWSFNLYDYEVPPWWWYKLPMKESEEEPFEPEESSNKAVFLYCNGNYPCASQVMGKAFEVDYINSTEKINFESAVKVAANFKSYGTYFYQYVFRDKVTGALRLNTIPMTETDDGDLKAFKYGAVDILAEGVVTKIHQGGDSTCVYWFKGDEALKKYIDCLHWYDK